MRVHTSLPIALLFAAAPAQAEPTLEMYISDAAEVFQGDPVSASLDAQGRISVGPVVTELGAGLDSPIVDLSPDGKGGAYAATAGGGLLHISAAGKAKTLATVRDKVVSAVTRRGKALWFAASPGAEVRTLSARRSKVIVDLKTKYIWDLLATKSGLYAATGKPGQVHKITGSKSKLIFDPKEAHVRSLLQHPKRGLLVGGGQKGVVYQVSAKGSARALYDSALDEVTALTFDPKTGDVYAAIVSASSKGALRPKTWIGPVKGDDPSADDKSPIRSGEIVRIRADGHVDVVWTSKREGALALAFDTKARRLLASTGSSQKNKARLYAIDVGQRDRVQLVARIDDALATSVVPATSGAWLLGSAPRGMVARIGPGTRARATYLSVEQDLKRSSRIGRLWFDADVPAGSKVSIFIRTGNTERPDKTWSGWSQGISQSSGGGVNVPRGRFAQFKAELSRGKNGAPLLKSMHASVNRMNVAPELGEVFMLRRGVYLKPLPSETSGEKTVTLAANSLKDLRGRKPAKAPRVRARQGSKAGMRTVSWKAKDPNHDGLIFSVAMRRLDPLGPYEEVARNLTVPFHSFDSRAYPDGRYQFRVSVSDRPHNPPDEALTDVLSGDPFVIDNKAPRLSAVRASAEGRGKIQLSAQAIDDHSAIEQAELSLDGGPWLLLPAKDGLLDGRSEALEVSLEDKKAPGAPKVPAGRHTVLVRVQDEAGNETTASTSVTTK